MEDATEEHRDEMFLNYHVVMSSGVLESSCQSGISAVVETTWQRVRLNGGRGNANHDPKERSQGLAQTTFDRVRPGCLGLGLSFGSAPFFGRSF